MATVLFTCAGQRVDVVAAFRAAGATTVVADSSPLAPTLYHADASRVVPRLDDPGYLPALHELIEEHGVQLVVPLTDLDHRQLADARDGLGATLLLSDREVVEKTADKYLAHCFFVERGIDSPPTWLPDELPDELDFPMLVKAREGFGSNHIYLARDRRELDFFLDYTPVPSMVQRRCRGEEFSIDVFCDLDGRCLNAIPRTMIQSKGGESIKGMSIKDERLIEVGRRVAEALPIKGPANVQCFREPDGRHEITDVNPRFGGAFPLPLAAGGGYPQLALALARGERPEPRLGDFREGILMTRFYSQVILSAGHDKRLAPLDGAPSAVPTTVASTTSE